MHSVRSRYSSYANDQRSARFDNLWRELLSSANSCRIFTSSRHHWSVRMELLRCCWILLWKTRATFFISSELCIGGHGFGVLCKSALLRSGRISKRGSCFCVLRVNIYGIAFTTLHVLALPCMCEEPPSGRVKTIFATKFVCFVFSVLGCANLLIVLVVKCAAMHSSKGSHFSCPCLFVGESVV